MTVPRAALHDLGAIAAAARRAADGDVSALPDAERRLLQRTTFGSTAADRARMEAIGRGAWLEEQLDFEGLDDSALEEALHDGLPSLAMSPAQLFDNYESNPFPPVFELWVATLYRAIYSPRQLFERMATFWSDHFNVDVFAEFQFMLKPVDHRDVVRANAMGTFPAMLRASAHSPAMLVYLTNDSNFKDRPNENYARELLELHTLGADNGYDQEDVRQVARCFTGWTVESPYRAQGAIGAFRFATFTHDYGAKTVLGRTINAGGGLTDGDKVLEILGGHRNTAAHIARKLVRYLSGYEPPQSTVRAVQRTFQRTGGDIRSLVRTALGDKRLALATPKIKRPFHMAVSALRALGADLQQPGWTLQQIGRAGHLPFAWSPPDGYPDDPSYWSGLILPRWNFAFGITDDSSSGVSLPVGLDSTQGSEASIVDRIDATILGGTMTASTRAQLLQFLSGKKNPRRVRETIALALASPEFQEY